MRSPRICAVTLLAAGITIAGCGASGSQHPGGGSPPASSASSAAAPPPATSTSSGAVTVQIANYAYAPATLTVKAGTKVKFVNHDATAHTATASGSPRFDTGTIKPGAQATVTLTKPGAYSYICQFHAFMKATITVS